MPGHSLHLSDGFEPPLPTGKYYPLIFEKRHGSRAQRETKQTILTIAGGSAKGDLQFRAYVTESLRAILAKDETRRKMLQYPRHLAPQKALMAPEVSAEAFAQVVVSHGAGLVHVFSDVKRKIYPDCAPRDHTLSPKLQPQGSSGTVSPLELDAATVN